MTGTHPLGDLSPTFRGSDPQFFATDGASDWLCFVASDSAGYSLWRTDGTPQGTAFLHSLRVGAGIQLGTRTLFAADEGARGYELWATDGTASGTVLVRDLEPGPGPSWPRLFLRAGEPVYFTANTRATGSELWRTDGTSAGTVMVRDLEPGPGDSSPRPLLDFHGTLLLAATTGALGEELWRSDGTPAGTVLVADLEPGTGSSGPQQLVALDGVVLFAATDSSHGNELWRTDGTAAGTSLVADLEPGPASAWPSRLVRVGDAVWFHAWDRQRGSCIWSSDGTPGGTRCVVVLPAGSVNVGLGAATLGATLVFGLFTTAFGGEAWRSDGTPTGTFLLRDLAPGEVSGVGYGNGGPFAVTAPRGADFALFLGADPDHGVELWRTDGTPAGTTLVHDLAPGPLGSFATPPVLVGSRWVFAANDRLTGTEPWSMPSRALAMAFGESCMGGDGQRPLLEGTGDAPAIGNARFAMTLSRARPGTWAVALVGFQREDLWLGGGCRLLVDPTALAAITLVPVDAAGRALMPLPIPFEPGLQGAQLLVQELVVDPGGALLGQFTLTHGLKLVVAAN